MQLSVFEANLTKEVLKRLEEKVMRQINLEEDSLVFYFLCEECVRKTQKIGKNKVKVSELMII